MERHGIPETQPKGVKMRDVWGKEVEIDPRSLDDKVRIVLTPLCLELGMDGADIAKYRNAESQLIGMIIARFRELQCSIETARKEFTLLRAKEQANYQLMLRFMRRFDVFTTIEDENTIIPIKKAA